MTTEQQYIELLISNCGLDKAIARLSLKMNLSQAVKLYNQQMKLQGLPGVVIKPIETLTDQEKKYYWNKVPTAYNAALIGESGGSDKEYRILVAKAIYTVVEISKNLK